MKKEVKAIMALVEAYRTSGGREEHFARRDMLENALEELVLTADELRSFYDLGYDVGVANCIKQGKHAN